MTSKNNNWLLKEEPAFPEQDNVVYVCYVWREDDEWDFDTNTQIIKAFRNEDRAKEWCELVRTTIKQYLEFHDKVGAELVKSGIKGGSKEFGDEKEKRYKADSRFDILRGIYGGSCFGGGPYSNDRADYKVVQVF